MTGRKRGFTLVELMAVVAIMGVMLAIAGVTIMKDPTARDISHRLSGMIGEAARKAISGGPMTPAAIAAEGTTARTRVRMYGAAGAQTAITERYNDTSAAWEIISKYNVARNIDVVGFRIASELNAGAAPNFTLAGGDQVNLECFPDGSCMPSEPASTGLTVYLREIDNPDQDARLVVLPLGGVPLVFGSW